MIHEYKELKYYGEVVFNKLVITAPERELKVFKDDEACFMFVDKGNFSVRTPEELISLKEGKGLLAKCFNFFVETTKEQRTEDNIMEVLGVYLFPSMVEELLEIDLSQSNYSLPYNYRQVQIDSLLDHYKDGISILLDNPEIADEAIIKTKLKEFILLISKMENAQSTIDFLSGMFRTNAMEFKSTIANNLYSNLSIEEFAILCGMSTSSFKRKFSTVYNESPKKYLAKMKLQRASKLLSAHDHRISDIAYECGYETISTFNRSFKAHFGQSPSDYRLSHSA